MCIKEFGSTATVADWDTDLKKTMSGDDVAAMADSLGIAATWGTSFYFVTKGGRKTFIQMPDSVYFFERHLGSLPSGWYAHDQYGGLSLGSHNSMNGQVLCRVRSTLTSTAAASTTQISTTSSKPGAPP